MVGKKTGNGYDWASIAENEADTILEVAHNLMTKRKVVFEPGLMTTKFRETM